MRFWSNKCERTPPAAGPAPIEPPALSFEEVQHARALSENGLRDAHQRDGEVRAAAGSLRRLRQDNHFAESMGIIFKERHV